MAYHDQEYSTTALKKFVRVLNKNWGRNVLTWLPRDYPPATIEAKRWPGEVLYYLSRFAEVMESQQSRQVVMDRIAATAAARAGNNHHHLSKIVRGCDIKLVWQEMSPQIEAVRKLIVEWGEDPSTWLRDPAGSIQDPSPYNWDPVLLETLGKLAHRTGSDKKEEIINGIENASRIRRSKGPSEPNSITRSDVVEIEWQYQFSGAFGRRSRTENPGPLFGNRLQPASRVSQAGASGERRAASRSQGYDDDGSAAVHTEAVRDDGRLSTDATNVQVKKEDSVARTGADLDADEQDIADSEPADDLTTQNDTDLATVFIKLENF